MNFSLTHIVARPVQRCAALARADSGKAAGAFLLPPPEISCTDGVSFRLAHRVLDMLVPEISLQLSLQIFQ